jgi:hypothetical protein
MTNDVTPTEEDDVGVLLRVIEGLLIILQQLKTSGALSRYEIAVINGGAAIADHVRRRHVGG